MLQKRDGPTRGKRTISSLENVAFRNSEPTGGALLRRGERRGKMRMAVIVYEKPAAKRTEKAAAISQIKFKLDR